MDHNSQGQGQGSRRQFHRGRRGADRRGQERRPQGPPRAQEQANRSDVDVEQIMRDIRSRIAQRHGIELSHQQIQDLAARRLESILDPRGVSPALLDQLRSAAGTPSPAPPRPADPPFTFEDTTLFESHRGAMRLARKLLHPILKLFFNPNPLIRALNIQARLNTEAAAREAERDRRQAEWNALHYALLQRVVSEISRVTLETQSLSLKVDSLSAKVDFNERRVRGIEGLQYQAGTSSGRREAPEPVRPTVIVVASPPSVTVETASAAAPTTQTTQTAPLVPPADGTRRRRRRRRGRRGTGAPGEAMPGGADAVPFDATDASDGDAGEPFEGGDEDESGSAEAESHGATAAVTPAGRESVPPAQTGTRPESVTPEPQAVSDLPPAGRTEPAVRSEFDPVDR